MTKVNTRINHVEASLSDIHHANERIDHANREIAKILDWIKKFCTIRPVDADEKMEQMRKTSRAKNEKRNKKREEKRALKRAAEEDEPRSGPQPPLSP